MNTVTIYVGGIGEGTMVHQKQAEQQAIFAAGVTAADAQAAEKLLVSSPLRERHYADPLGEVFIDTATGSPEFSRLSADLQSTVDQIRHGDCSAELGVWFTPDVAEALPERVAEVEVGTGAQAVLSRGAADLDARRIIGDIRSAIRRAWASDEHTVVLVIAGVGSGGTGTGAFLEIVRLARVVADSLGHITLVAIPVLGARGCEILQRSQRETDALYARTAGGLLATVTGQAAFHAVPYALTDDLTLSVSQLADIVWAVEGDQGDPSATRREPMFGLARTAHGIVDAMVAESGVLAGMIPAWRMLVGQADPNSRLGSAGAASIRTDSFHLHLQAAYALTRAFYEGVVSRPDGSGDGESHAAQLLAAFLPATFARMLASGQEPQWSAPGGGVRSIGGIAQMITDPEGESGPFPSPANHDVRWLADEVHTAAWPNLFSISNKAVVANCDATVASYLGDPRAGHHRSDEWTVNGWLGANRKRVVSDFTRLLDAEMLERTIDPNAGRAYTLEQKPSVVADTADFLSILRSRFIVFRDEAQNKIDTASRLVEQRAVALSKLRSELHDARPSARLQREFVAASQNDLDIRVWLALMTTLVDIANGWILEVDSWLKEAGEDASGWFSYLKMLADDVRAREQELLAARRKMASAANHVYMPSVGGAGEAALIEEFIRSSGALAALRASCRLTWTKMESGEPRLLLEGIDAAPARERKSVVARLRVLGADRAHSFKVENHVSADTLHFAQTALRASFESLTLADGMSYEYTHVEIPLAESQGRTPSVNTWTSERVDSLLRGAKAELSLDGAGGSDVYREQVAWGPLTLAGVHPLAAEVTAAMSDRLTEGSFTITDTPSNRTIMRAFEVLLRVPFDAPTLYPRMIDALRRVPAEQLGLYAPESSVRRAEKLARVIEEHGYRRRPWTFCPSVASLAADRDGTDGALRRTTLGLLADLFDVIPGNGADPDELGIVERGKTLANFGEGDEVEIIRNLRDPLLRRAVAVLDSRIEKFVSTYRHRDGSLDFKLASRIEDDAISHWFASDTPLSRAEKDVKLILLAEALTLAEAFARKAGRAGSAESKRGSSRKTTKARVATDTDSAISPVPAPAPTEAAKATSQSGVSGNGSRPA